MEAGVVVEGAKETKCHRNNQKINKDAQLFPRLLREHSQTLGLGSALFEQQKKKDWQTKNDFGSIANRHRKESAGNDRAKMDQHEIKGRDLTKQCETERDLPRAAE